MRERSRTSSLRGGWPYRQLWRPFLGKSKAVPQCFGPLGQPLFVENSPFLTVLGSGLRQDSWESHSFSLFERLAQPQIHGKLTLSHCFRSRSLPTPRFLEISPFFNVWAVGSASIRRKLTLSHCFRFGLRCSHGIRGKLNLFQCFGWAGMSESEFARTHFFSLFCLTAASAHAWTAACAAGTLWMLVHDRKPGNQTRIRRSTRQCRAAVNF